MKTYRIAEAVMPDQYVEVGGKLYRAMEMRKDIPCKYQCDLYNVGKGRCSGHCFRWANVSDIVFKETDAPAGNYSVMETKCGRENRLMAKALEEAEKNDSKT